MMVTIRVNECNSFAIIHSFSETARMKVLTLCKKANILFNQTSEMMSTFSCGYVYKNKQYGRLMPFKAELLWPDPVLLVYHDVISDKEIDLVKRLTEPKLETTEVHSFTTHKKMKSLARIGKT